MQLTWDNIGGAQPQIWKHWGGFSSPAPPVLPPMVTPTKELIASILRRLELKGKKFEVFDSAPDEEIRRLWNILLTLEASLAR